MKLRVDAEKCQGHGRCYAIAPELFDVDEMGAATAKPEVPDGLEEKAKLAMANCPEEAIEFD